MKKSIRITFIMLMVALCTLPIHAFDKEFKELLNSKELKRLESAEKLIAKGDAFIDETKELEKEVEQLKNADGRIKTGKINKRNKKIAQIKSKAALYYEDGYKKYINILDDRLKALDKSGNSEARQTRKDIKALEKKARKQYNKAENLSSPEKVIELLELAQKNQQRAIELQTQCLMNLSEYKTSEPELVAEVASTMDSTLVEPVIAEKSTLQKDTMTISSVSPKEASVPETTVAPITPSIALMALPTAVDSTLVSQKETPAFIKTEPIIIEEPIVVNPDIFLTIQIMADKKKATDEQIISIYNGNKEVIEKKVNDWFKYSVGKYQSIDKAKSDMKAENIKGFIVAYNKNERISVKEAVTLLNGES